MLYDTGGNPLSAGDKQLGPVAGLRALSELISRADIMTRAGVQYGTDRDLYETLGYDRDPQYEDYWQRYLRMDVAKAVNNIPVKYTWRGLPTVREYVEARDKNTYTEFDRIWDQLTASHKLMHKFKQVDKVTGIGGYGVLFLGYSDITSQLMLEQPVTPGAQLLYVKARTKDSARIAEYETDPGSERYGKPKYYTVTTTRLDEQVGVSLKVHHTRIVHIVEDYLDDEVNGIPRLEVVLNRLYDLEKLVGGAAEMFWRGARPGYAAIADKDANFGRQDREDMENELNEFDHYLRRWLRLKGVQVESLAPQVESPKDQVDVCLQMISMVTGIPKRILIGSERGELASTQDQDAWYSQVTERREEFAGPGIILPTITMLQESGVLPDTPNGIQIDWPDLWSQSDEQKATVAQKYAAAIKDYVGTPGAEIYFPIHWFAINVMGFSEEDAEELQNMVDDRLAEIELEDRNREPKEEEE